MTSEVAQQSARVNIDDERWRQFRILTIESDRSIADYLGQLVCDELRRSWKRRRRTDEGAPPMADDTRRRPPAGEAPGRPMRLADVQLLTELPHPAEPSQRSTQPP